MLNIAYLNNEFPAAVEPYVWEEIVELRRHGIAITPCSVRRPWVAPEEANEIASQTVYFFPVSLALILRSVVLCFRHLADVIKILRLALTHRQEPLRRRIRAVAHTLLGVYYVAMLKSREVEHIHVHHGYFAAWIAMTAARLMGIAYSMTLHGSDLLLHHAFLDLKLQNCKFCLTVSEFNRRHILANYPDVSPEKIRIQRMGVDALNSASPTEDTNQSTSRLVMLSVGRLHEVKDHAFLIRACGEMKLRGVNLMCLIAGEGPERQALGNLIRDLGLQREVTLLGHVPRGKLETYYAMCDMVVLTSRSEGIPLTLMEAMAQGRTVLAPAITGIPELVVDGVTGFLYRSGSMDDFIAKIEAIQNSKPALRTIRYRARRHVLENFNRATNLAEFAEIFPVLIAGNSDENYLLQQI